MKTSVSKFSVVFSVIASSTFISAPAFSEGSLVPIAKCKIEPTYAMEQTKYDLVGQNITSNPVLCAIKKTVTNGCTNIKTESLEVDVPVSIPFKASNGNFYSDTRLICAMLMRDAKSPYKTSSRTIECPRYNFPECPVN